MKSTQFTIFCSSAKGRKTLRPGAIPTKNLPTKSHPTVACVERRHINIVKDAQEEKKFAYKSFQNLKQGLQKLRSNWVVSEHESFVNLQLFDKELAVPKFHLKIDEDFELHIAVFNWKLPLNNFLYNTFRKSLKYSKLAEVICDVEETKICDGISKQEAKASAIKHVIPKALNFDDTLPYQFGQFFRAKTCQVFQSKEDCSPMCIDCATHETKCTKEAAKRQVMDHRSIKAKAPLAATSHSRLKATVLEQRAKCRLLEEKIKEMDKEIAKSSVTVDDQLSGDINEIMTKNLEKASPFMQLFWQEQTKKLWSGSKEVSSDDHKVLFINCCQIRICIR
eukprot:Seg3501.1 transcript_id=Seg3501.1/GoldUCD/mRNA.D3Y31 product="hypothetical protein" protein_id=Seg3501.1/GoldUCD/D3Y31